LTGGLKMLSSKFGTNPIIHKGIGKIGGGKCPSKRT